VPPPLPTRYPAVTARHSQKLKRLGVRIGIGCAALTLVVVLGAAIQQFSAHQDFTRLVAEARQAHNEGHLEDAVQLLHDAAISGSSGDEDEIQPLLRQYERELSREQEPRVASLIDSARAAIASGDTPKAISLLTQAKRFSSAPNWTEADELLRQIKPPEPSSPTPYASPDRYGGFAQPDGSRVTMSNYQRITTGMSLPDVEAILGPGSEQASSESKGLLTGTSVKSYSWSGEGFRDISVLFVNGKVTSKAQVGLQ
jgi:hypothetical protein